MDDDGRLTGEELRTLLAHEGNLPPDDEPDSIVGQEQQRLADRHQIQKLQSTVAELEDENKRLEGELADIREKILNAFNQARHD